MGQMNIVSSDEEVHLLLYQVDPFNNQRMTYSEIVHMLSSHMVPRSNDNQQLIPLLEKFVNEGDEQNVHTQMDDESGDELDRRDTREEKEYDRAEFPESEHEEFEREQRDAF